MNIFLNPRFRLWFYGIICVTIPILLVYGIFTNETAQLWLNWAAAVLGVSGTGLALNHVDTSKVVDNGTGSDPKSTGNPQ